MQRERNAQRLRPYAGFSIGALAIATALSLLQGARAADEPIDLDKNAANGSESKVSTKVLQTYPVRIENTVVNNAAGTGFNFLWAGAGPGGFNSFVTPGPGVGTKWVWSTVYQVYTVTSPVAFTPSRALPTMGSPSGGVQTSGSSPGGSFTVQGKSIYPTQITVSDASLTASLITFFSPEKTVASCGVQCAPGECELFLENESGGSITVDAEQLDCCPDPHNLLCGGECKAYLTDTQNCGGCGNVCAAGEICSNGACVCPPGQADCGSGCIDITGDTNNCGGCGSVCNPEQTCSDETCFCPAGQAECGAECVDTQDDRRHCGTCGFQCEVFEVCAGGQCNRCEPPYNTSCNNVCVNTYTDPNNCGACGAVCDFSACPGGAQGRCSDGQYCICDPGVTGSPSGTSKGSSSLSLSGGSAGISGSALPSTPGGKGGARGQAVGLRFAPTPPEQVVTSSVPLTAAPFAGSDPVNQLLAGAVAPSVQEAPVCEIAPIQQVIPPGGVYTQVQTGGRFGKEVQTSVSITVDGKVVAQGPCPQIVPVTGVDTSGVILSALSVGTRDTSGDGLCQPGEERCEYFITVADLGDTPCQNPVATLTSPPDAFNPNTISIVNGVVNYPNIGGYPGDGLPLEKATNLSPFTVSLPASQAADVGRPFLMTVACSNLPTPVEMALTLGIGAACNPATRTLADFDGVSGLAGPVNARLVAKGTPVNYSSRTFNNGSTIPLKFSLSCGAQGLNAAAINPRPVIAGLDHETLGALPLTGINGDNNANPDDPGFSCGSSGCEYQLRTDTLPPGRIIISIQMPDNRIFQAGVGVNP